MAKISAFLVPMDPKRLKPLVKASRLRFGRFEARGVTAILFGVAAIVVAGGASAALRAGATILPETLRESRELWLAVRGRPRQLTATP